MNNTKKTIATATKSTATKSTATKSTATANALKVNATVDFESLFTALCKCETKRALVDTMNAHGLRTTTLPTTTPNKNDLYIQFCEKSRILFGAKTIKFYTNDATATDDAFKSFTFDHVNDGSYRTKRATVTKSVDNFTLVMKWFIDHYETDMKLPTTATANN